MHFKLKRGILYVFVPHLLCFHLYLLSPLDLRKAVYTPSSRQQQVHVHSYSEEQYNSSDDTWTKTCQECGHSITFEKL